jgi:hypothetical protein
VFKKESLPSWIAALMFLGYLSVFYLSLNGRLLNPNWTNDDSTQQTFVFHEVLKPELFKGDIIFEVMRGYLTPIHYWLGYLITLFTESPVMTGHILHIIQFVLTILFLFLAVKGTTGSVVPAFFAATWLIHTRTVMERLSGGLTRGWAAVIIAAFLWAALSGKHRRVALVLLIGCLLHPPATFLCAAAYGIWLLFLLIKKESRLEGLTALKIILPLAPIYGLITWLVIRRPPEIGQMIDYQTAATMGAFKYPTGRFPFIPQPSITEHLHFYGFNPFFSWIYNPGDLIINYAWVVIILGLLAFLILGARKRTPLVPSSLWCFLLGIAGVYLLSRQVMFKLYVPDRHLLIPMTFFLILAFTIGAWSLFKKSSIKSSLALVGLGLFIYICSGTGLYGEGDIRYHIHRYGRVFDWVRKYSPENSVVAGHPTTVDPTLLFGMRRVYVSTETAHPFYLKFYTEMERRLEISFRAHYASSAEEFLEIIKNEPIDYFIFSRKKFSPEALKAERYHTPLDGLVLNLCSKDPRSYFFRKLPRTRDIKKHPFVKYADEESTIIDVRGLKEFLERNRSFGESNRV